MIGQVLGHYRIEAKIGEGGMGVVYRARDEVLQRDVAIKVLSKKEFGDTSAKDFLLHEARSSSALSHPNICTIYEVGELGGGELYIVMELIEGKPLNVLAGTNGLSVELVLRYGTQIAAALAHSHNRDIVHRDLKTSNIVVTPEGLVKVLDFGLAKRKEKELLEGITLTISPAASGGTQSLTGTLQYMAPEILSGQEADARSDIWALGVVLYELASGQLPFKGRTAFEISSAILHDLPPPLPAHVPPGLWAVVQRCLSKDPALRYQRAAEVQAALEPLLTASAIGRQTAGGQPQGFSTTVLRGMRHLQVTDGDVLLMVGTVKGAFLLRSRRERKKWEIAGPYFHGLPVYAMAYDDRNGRHRLWLSTFSMVWGAVLRSSNDFGKIWTNPLEANVKFPADCGVSLKNIWQICLGREGEPDKMYCGVEPAALFESRDAGESWSLVRGLFDHPHRPRWVPGNGGLCLHTILLDPQDNKRMHVAISAGGVYRTDDGGCTWQARNCGIRVVFAPERYPEFGQCVHKIARHPSRPERLFLQNHWGLYRSEDSGDSWQDIANGVPSDFGFPVVVHPRDPDCVYILPVESDEFRCTPEERLRVYRTRNAGASWEALTRGLPQKGAYVTVLRDGMVADSLDPAGIYFGTRSGEVYASADEGKSWKRIVEGLPAVCCVKTALIGDGPGVVRGKGAMKKGSTSGAKLGGHRGGRGGRGGPVKSRRSGR